MMLEEKRHIRIMGIVNLTDDSFYGPSRRLGEDQETLAGTVQNMLRDGADIIDLGACSTRPGSVPVSERIETERLCRVMPMLREAFPEVALSVDTFRSGVVRRLYEAVGPFLVNDISGAADPAMLPLVAACDLPYVATCPGPDPEAFFDGFARRADAEGVREWILDPGFGFGKTLAQNYEVFRGMASLARFGREILVGVSRKSMIYKKFSITPGESLPATQVLHLRALQLGADILRVHDVAEAARTVNLYQTLCL